MTLKGSKPGPVLKRPPHDIITEGVAVGVLLSNRPARAWIDRADFERIVKTHGNRGWLWVEAARYVKLRTYEGADVPIARLVVGDAGHFIRYADGDRLNLRRKNLSTEEPVRPGAGVKREKPKEGLVATPRAPRVPKAAASRPVVTPRAKTSPPRLSAFLRASESRLEVSPQPSPPTMMLPKRTTPVVATVKRPVKPVA